MAILTEVKQLVDGVDIVTAKDIMDTQETAISAINKAEEALEKANNAPTESYDDTELRQLIASKLPLSGGTITGTLGIVGWTISQDSSGNLVFTKG